MDVDTHAFLHGTEAVALLLAVDSQLKISRSFLPIRRKCDFTAQDCTGCARESIAGSSRSWVHTVTKFIVVRKKVVLRLA